MKKQNVLNLIKYHVEKNDIAFRNEAELLKIQGSDNGFKIEKLDPCNYLVTVPAAGFAIFEYRG